MSKARLYRHIAVDRSIRVNVNDHKFLFKISKNVKRLANVQNIIIYAVDFHIKMGYNTTGYFENVVINNKDKEERFEYRCYQCLEKA